LVTPVNCFKTETEINLRTEISLGVAVAARVASKLLQTTGDVTPALSLAVAVYSHKFRGPPTLSSVAPVNTGWVLYTAAWQVFSTHLARATITPGQSGVTYRVKVVSQDREKERLEGTDLQQGCDVGVNRGPSATRRNTWLPLSTWLPLAVTCIYLLPSYLSLVSITVRFILFSHFSVLYFLCYLVFFRCKKSRA